MDQPLISVILSIYNVAPYIEKCMLSLLAQTYQNIELILVDDCSPDNSVDIALNTLAKHSFTRYQLIRHLVNSGAAEGRNTGKAAAKGEFFYFMDNDDFAEPTLLADLLQPFTLGDPDIDIVLCNFWRFYSETGIREVGFASPFQGKTDPRLALKAIFNEKEHAYVWRCLYKRKCLDTILFAKGVPVEDMMTTPLLWAHATSLFFIPGLLYNYVIRPGSVMMNWKNVDRWYNVPEFMERNERIFKTQQALRHLYKDILLYHYTMLRNYSLVVVQGENGFAFYKPLLEKYRHHIKSRLLLRYLLPGHKQLVAHLLLLKAGSLVFWKKFRTA